MIGLSRLMPAGLPNAWDVTTFLENVFKTVKLWGGWVMLIVGAAMIVVAVWKTASALMSHGGGQVSWPKIIILFLLGGALVATGATGSAAFEWVSKIGEGGKDTLDKLGQSTPTIVLDYLRGLHI